MAPLLTLRDFRGGRNGFDPPHTLPDNQVVEALNVDWYGASLARRRGGAIAVSQTGGTAFNTTVYRLFRFQPGSDEGAAEMWASGSDSGNNVMLRRLAGGTTWADVTGDTLIAGTNYGYVETTTLDGRLYIAAQSATGSRLLVYDPTLSSPQVRYVGHTTPGAPTAADTGSGSYAAIIRYYRVRWIQRANGLTKIIRRSEGGTALGWTPSGSGTAVRVTQPTAPAEGETHWELEVSTTLGPGNTGPIAPWYRIATTAIATTTYDDSNVVSTYPTFTLSADTGEYTTWTNARYIITDHNRLIGAGSHISGEKTSRVYFSAVLGSSDEGDVERVPNSTTHKNFLDLNENDGGAITGLVPSLNGSFYVFKRRQIWRLMPTGDDVTPYLPRLVTSAFGTISQASISSGRDHEGHPTVYFWSEEGPCRLTTRGDGSTMVQYIGEDIRDLTSQITFSGFAQNFPCSVYYAGKHQVWFWFSYVNGSAETILVKAVFDIGQGVIVEGDQVRGGWSIHSNYTTGGTMSHNANCAVMFAKTLGASMSLDLVPYVGLNTGTVILRCDTTDTTDNANNFQAYVRTKPLLVTDFGQNAGMGVSSVLADAASGVTITQSYVRDFGLETRTSTVSLTAAASETKVMRKFEDAEISGAGTVQVQLGDGSALAATQWKLHEWSGSVYPQEPR